MDTASAESSPKSVKGNNISLQYTNEFFLTVIPDCKATTRFMEILSFALKNYIRIVSVFCRFAEK